MSNSSKTIYHEQRTDALTDRNKNMFKYTNVFKGFYINSSEKVKLYINYVFTTRLHFLFIYCYCYCVAVCLDLRKVNFSLRTINEFESYLCLSSCFQIWIGFIGMTINSHTWFHTILLWTVGEKCNLFGGVAIFIIFDLKISLGFYFQPSTWRLAGCS